MAFGKVSETMYGELVKGDVIVAKNGTHSLVTGVRTLESDSGTIAVRVDYQGESRVIERPLDAPVKVWIVAAPDPTSPPATAAELVERVESSAAPDAVMARAVEIVTEQLGADKEAERDGDGGPWKSPRPGPMTIPTHLKLMHGEYVGDIKAYAEMVECHRASHEDAARPDKKLPHGYIDHVHTKETGR